MANDTPLTIVGNLTADPELRFTQSGVPVTGFTVASTPRAYNRTSNEWEDGETLFLRCSVWRDPAENAAGSLSKGSRVVVTGRLKQRSFQTTEGENRTVLELEVDEVAASLRYAVVTIQKVQRDHSGGGAPVPAGQDAWSSDQFRDDTPF